MNEQIYFNSREKRDVVDMLEQRYARIVIRTLDNGYKQAMIINLVICDCDVWRLYDGIVTNPRLKVMELLGIDIDDKNACEYDWYVM